MIKSNMCTKYHNMVADLRTTTVSLTFNNVEGNICVVKSTATDVSSGVISGHLTDSQRAVPLKAEFMVVWRIHVTGTHHLKR